MHAQIALPVRIFSTLRTLGWLVAASAVMILATIGLFVGLKMVAMLALVEPAVFVINGIMLAAMLGLLVRMARIPGDRTRPMLRWGSRPRLGQAGLVLVGFLLFLGGELATYEIVAMAFGPDAADFGRFLPRPEDEILDHPIDAAIGAALISPLIEEAIFRGWLMARLGAVWQPGSAILLSAGLFSLVHIGGKGIIALIWTAIFGLYLGFLRVRYGGIGLPFAVHATNNAIAIGLAYLMR